MGNKWTKQEYDLLRTAYSNYPIVFSPVLLSRHTESACRLKSKALGIRQLRFHTIFCNQEISDIDLSYIAAFLDGEGSIYLNEQHKKYFVSFSNSDYGVIQWMHNMLKCGQIETRKATPHYTMPHYMLRVARLSDTIYMLKKLIPFMHIKASLATIAVNRNMEVLNKRT